MKIPIVEIVRPAAASSYRRRKPSRRATPWILAVSILESLPSIPVPRLVSRGPAVYSRSHRVSASSQVARANFRTTSKLVDNGVKSRPEPRLIKMFVSRRRDVNLPKFNDDVLYDWTLGNSRIEEFRLA